MKQFYLIFFIVFFISTGSFGQSYYEHHKKCSEILAGIPIGDEIFWNNLKLRDSCLLGLETPFFEVTTLENEKLNIDVLKGKVVVLNFWFTRCAPCIEEMPFLNKIVSEYKNSEVVFLGIANEDSLTLHDFLRSTKFDFKIVPNGSRILIDTFKLFSAWPTTVIIDRDSKIRFIGLNKLNVDETDFKAILNEALK